MYCGDSVVRLPIARFNGELSTYLGTTGSVLSGTTGKVDGGVLGLDLLVDGEMLLLGEDGIVGLQLILVKQSLVAVVCMSFLRFCIAPGRIILGDSRSGLDIWRRVLGISIAGLGAGVFAPRRGFPRQKRVYSVDMFAVMFEVRRMKWDGREVMAVLVCALDRLQLCSGGGVASRGRGRDFGAGPWGYDKEW